MGSSFGGVSRLSGVDAAALAEAPLAHLSPLGSVDSIPELALGLLTRSLRSLRTRRGLGIWCWWWRQGIA